jgi:hypothetical protein
VRDAAKRSATGLSNSGQAGSVRTRLLLVLTAAAVLTAVVFGVTAASAAAPVLTVESVSEISYTSAKATGKSVFDSEANGGSDGFRFFQWCHPDSPGECTETGGNWHNGPEAFGHVQSAGSEETVEEQLTGLPAGAEVLVRLTALPFSGGEIFSPEPYEAFSTDPVAKPGITNLEVTSLTSESAHFSATVDPNAPSPDDPAFETNWEFTCVPSCGSHSGEVVKGAPATVEADATSLEPSLKYTVTLKATNAGGSEEASTEFTPTATKPLVRAFAAGPIQADQVDLNGEVNPRNQPTKYWFEWGTQDCSANTCTATAKLPAGLDELQQISTVAEAGTFNLTFEGQTTPDLPFNASPHDVQGALEALSSVGAGNVSLTGGAVGRGMHYRVTFVGDLARTDVKTIIGASGTPPLTVDEGVNPGSIQVSNIGSQGGYAAFYTLFFHHLVGLAPSTTYHFRLLAENPSGLTEGPDEEFTTAAPDPACSNQGMPGTDALPDCRAYEMVSPPDKNGVNVLTISNKAYPSADGNGLAFAAAGAFGDVKGTSTDVEYLARRTGEPGGNGWSTHSITPRTRSGNFRFVFASPTFEAAFTPDLSRAIYRSGRIPAGEPNVENFGNLFRLDGLDSSSPQLQLLNPSVAPLEEINPGFQVLIGKAKFAGASTDLSHVIFQHNWDLTNPAPPVSTGGSFSFNERLYEYADGAGVRLVGRVPSSPETECDDSSGNPCVPAESSTAGIDANQSFYVDKMVSTDGSRIAFATLNGVYLREDGERTYQLNASEQSLPGEPGSAQIWTMSADGSRVFFTSQSGLVDDAGAGIYMYDLSKPAGDRLTFIAPAQGVIGASADGRSLYFISNSRLLAGQPPDDPSAAGSYLYLWRDSQLVSIGQFLDPNQASTNTPRTSFGGRSTVRLARVSPNGRYLLFSTEFDTGFRGRGGFTGYDHGEKCAPTVSVSGSCREVYLYDAAAGRLTCTSCNPLAYRAGSSVYVDASDPGAVSPFTQYQSNALSDDGHYVFFSTRDGLVQEDTNGVYDAYEYEVRTGEVHLISSGTDGANSFYLNSSPDGSNVFFATRQPLLGWDDDGAYDVYDARVNGGFAEPKPIPAPCAGESCLSAPPSAPAPPSTASQTAGDGNAKQVCPRGKRPVRRHGKLRCVKKGRKAHAKTHKQRTHHHRRAGR